MKINVWLGTGLLLLGGVACSDDGPTEAYCEAWDGFQAEASDGGDRDTGRDFLVKMSDEAPEDIADDIDSFLADFDQALEAGDPSLLDQEGDAERNQAIDEFGADC